VCFEAPPCRRGLVASGDNFQRVPAPIPISPDAVAWAMATIRLKRKGVDEVRDFAGCGDRGKRALVGSVRRAARDLSRADPRRCGGKDAADLAVGLRSFAGSVLPV